MKKAFAQVHLIKFTPLKLTNPLLDFILQPIAGVYSCQDTPSLLQEWQGEGSILRGQSHTNIKPL